MGNTLVLILMHVTCTVIILTGYYLCSLLYYCPHTTAGSLFDRIILIITLLSRCSYYLSVYQPRALSLIIELGREACTSCLDFVGIFVHAAIV